MRDDQHDPLDLAAVRSQHEGDRPSASHRLELLSRIEMNAARLGGTAKSPLASTARAVRGGLIAWGALAAAAAGAVLWLGQSKPIHPEPPLQPTVEPLAPNPLHVPRPPTVPCRRGSGSDGLLATFEVSATHDPALLVPELDGRSGRWFHTRNTVDRDVLEQPLHLLPSPDPTPHNRRALHVTGAPPVGWGANFGIRFTDCYDASRYAGLEFRAKGPGSVFVAFQTMDSVPVAMGGRCTNKCWFTGGRYITLGDEFAAYRVLWKDVSPPDPSYDLPSELLQIAFNVQSGSQPYDLWLDDLRLVAVDE